MNAARTLVPLGAAPFIASAAFASAIPQQDIGGLYHDAEIVVHGRVVDQATRFEEYDGNRVIFTYSTVKILSSAKAPADARFYTVRTVGGAVNGLHQALIGEAQIDPDEEVVLFLEREPDWNHRSIVGFHQGKLSVQRNLRGDVQSFIQEEGQFPGDRRFIKQEFSPAQFDALMEDAVLIGAEHLDEGLTCCPSVVHTLVPVSEREGIRLEQPAGEAQVGMAQAFSLGFAAPTCPDVNHDGVVDVLDFVELLGAFGTDSPVHDLDENGTVDVFDVSRVASGMGPCE